MQEDEPSVEKMLDDAVWAFVLVRRRYPLLVATLDELERLEARFPDHHANDGVLRLVHDSFDMLVIDLCSVREGLVSSKGLLNGLRRDQQAVRRRVPSEFRTSVDGRAIDDFLARRIAADINAAIDRLFGASDPVTEQDVLQLIARFRADTKSIYLDRNKVRAHRYEPGARDWARCFIPLRGLEAEIETLEKYLKDLHLAITSGSFAMDLNFDASPQAAGQDLADIIIHGSINCATLAYGMAGEASGPDAPAPWYWAKRQVALGDREQ